MSRPMSTPISLTTSEHRVLLTETSTQRTFSFIQSVGLSWLTLAWRLGPVVLL